MKEIEAAIHLLTKNYRNKALDTFIRGLRGDLPRLLGMREPADLSEALHLCLKLDNQQFRTQQATNNSRAHPMTQRRQNDQKQTFYPQLTYYPQATNFPGPNLNNFRPPHAQGLFAQNNVNNNRYANRHMNYNRPQFPTNYNSQPPPRPTQQKPPTPMDVDTSIRSRTMNYMNRPVPNNNRFTGVRPLPQSMQVHQPAKFQRINHIDTNAEDTDLSSDNPEDGQDNDNCQDLPEYLDQYFEQEGEDRQEDEFEDIHFLE